MAKNDEKYEFPRIPVKHWWGLRERFRKSIPASVTKTYLASTLGMSERSARVNILLGLKKTGIVDENGKTTDRTKLWRDDAKYADVCKAILKERYPQELLDFAPDDEGEVDRSAIASWMAMKTGAGENMVAKYLSLFLLLLEADPAKAPDKIVTTKTTKTTKTATTKTKAEKPASPPQPKQPPATGVGLAPSINLNVQVHVSPDATPEQIDQVFKSIAKHLKDFSKSA